ncbi:MAG: 16S rRNA (guanine(966)-N(2))-methyltransferase RsmD [Acaryochloridaceae cyanobacterium SU_2_1]|nr:16S rRNA (guanine(966)-N(2))-methyltransferase RsmD [Acaryochloridaceae cyanobacterium SU_2_1]NJM95639.1 16S rRNA (guanine(966)-N(2))-methyltransferase RsmD [Acaryochloridaceae cyanobacterium CSU_5_19]
MVRIYGNRRLKTLAGPQTRPTTARVREMVFHRWRDRISDCRWLDLCAGCGSMGAEALCRGAALVYGIEQARAACRVTRLNWQQVASPEQIFRLWQGEVTRILPQLQGEVFDLIYFDPPYDSDLYGPVLQAIADHQLLKPTGELAVEHRPRQGPTPSANFQVSHTRAYGNTALTLLRIAPDHQVT